MFDVKDYLDTIGVDFKSHGKNVGSNDVNICCPFCNEGQFHLGIRRDKLWLNCWVCDFAGEKRRPSFVNLMMILENISYGVAKQKFDEMTEGDVFEVDESSIAKRGLQVELPTEARGFDDRAPRSWKSAFRYLKSRGFGWDEIDKYRLHYCPNGRFALRVIAPVYFKRQLVNYVGRDFTGLEDRERYKNCLNEDAVFFTSELLYGYDQFRGKKLRLVEGITDVWRIGDTALALFSKKMSRHQRRLIYELNVDTMIVALDGDAFGKSYEIAQDFEPFIPEIKVIKLGDEDPCDLGLKRLREIERATKVFKS